MSLTINTNKSAMVALQNLNSTSDKLGATQNKVGTGLRIANSKDNSSIWAIAQNQRADIGGLSSVKMGLDRAQSIGDVALTAGQSISELLVQMKEKVVAAQDASITTTSRRALDADFKSLLAQISQVIRNASFDGADLLDNSLPGGLRFLADADATTYVTLANQDLSLGSTIITLASTSSITSTTLASNALSQLQASIGNVSLALARMGAQVRQIENHNKFVGKLSDSIEAGIGNLVDADLAKESARLQALQVQQQLGAQALSIANQSPNIILSLFRGGS
ncbi:flagellin [Phenylobacterium sp.]|jgi:flagellin|uniref:flagellin n=1 Tax=Phenylobacterium sp. TaxID=1871053 RepID=UPI0037CC9D47